MSRAQLLDRVWGITFPGGTRTVDVHVGQLRRKLGRPAADPHRARRWLQGRPVNFWTVSDFRAFRGGEGRA